jgi:hypothetical protein
MITFDKFENIFMRANKPWWVLYKGANKGQQIGSNFSGALRETDAVEAPTIDSSFNELSQLLSDYGDGVYTVEMRSHPKASRGNDMHQVAVGEAPTSRRDAVSGIGNNNPAVGFFQGLDGRYFMDQISGKTNALQEAQLALLKKEMEVQDLKRQLKEKVQGGDLGDRVFGLLEKQPQILDRLLGSSAPAAVGLLRAEKPIPAQNKSAENGTEYGDEDGESYTPGKLDLNDLVEDAMRIQRAIPGMHINDVFAGLADYVEKDPATAESYLKMIIG